MLTQSKRRIRSGGHRGGLATARNNRRRKLVALQRELDWCGSEERAAQIRVQIETLRAGVTLTDPQIRVLLQIRAQPGRTYNGRARRTLDKLAVAGLIEFDYELVPHEIGTWGERFICRPKGDS